jgi:hypothetical protein
MIRSKPAIAVTAAKGVTEPITRSSPNELPIPFYQTKEWANRKIIYIPGIKKRK